MTIGNVIFEGIRRDFIPLSRTRSGSVYDLHVLNAKDLYLRFPLYFKLVLWNDRDIVYFVTDPYYRTFHQMNKLIINPIEEKKDLKDLISCPDIIFFTTKNEYGNSWGLTKVINKSTKLVENLLTVNKKFPSLEALRLKFYSQ